MAQLTPNYGGLGPEETKVLEEDRLVSPLTIRGTRKVSASLLAPPANRDSSYGSGSLGGFSSYSAPSSSSSPASVRFKSFRYNSNFTLDLPDSAYSAAALEFIGFTPQTASQIVENWNGRPQPEQCPDDLLDYALAWPSQLSLPRFQHLSLMQVMTKFGLSPEFRDAIMNPRFSALLWKKSPAYWIRDTLRINYLTLLQLQSRLSNHAIRRLAEKSKRASLQAALNPANPTTPSIVEEGEAPRAAFSTSPQDHNLPKTYITMQSATPVLEDHYILYKAKAASEMEEWIQDDGSLEMRVVQSFAGRDFNHQDLAAYWTPERETAETYRTWTERRCPWSDTWLIQVQVPANFIHGLRQQELWFSPNWKEYVWHCKKRKEPPIKYDSYWGADLIKGHISTGAGTSIKCIKKEEIQTSMSENNLVMISSGRATQWVIMQRSVNERMGIEIRGKIHIDITAAKAGADLAAESSKTP